MKISESWLREFVNPSISCEQLATQLTMAGLEVESITPVAGEFSGVVVAEVISTKAHPQAEKLTLCEVNVGDDQVYRIVCGAINVRPGLKVALAQCGAHLPGGIKIKPVKLRGELSQGMLCSACELGLEDASEGIIELPFDAPIGMNIRQYMMLDDHVLDIDLTPNRADCLSVFGIAREVAAINELVVQPSSINTNLSSTDMTLDIHIHEKEACPKYAGRVIRLANSSTATPLWLKERLRRCGFRSIHPVVDVTNYVMLELGQPMHAFNIKSLDRSIHVRYAKHQETLTLLDGQTIQLSPKMLVIADDNKPVALAGVMGGQDSAVCEGTIEVFLESAFFNPLVVAGVARSLGIMSDSSQRFERGVDPSLPIRALERATELLLSMVGGEAGPISCHSHDALLPFSKSIQFNPASVKKIAGIDIPYETMHGILERLMMLVTDAGGEWSVTVPTHRVDVSMEVDLIEEIIRIYGYHNLEGRAMTVPLQAGQVNCHERLSMKMAHFLSHRGYQETISYGFVDPTLQTMLFPGFEALNLLNPISQELSQMRLSLWPGLLASMIYNAHHQQTEIRLFEHGVVFEMAQGELQESPRVAGLLMGEYGRLNWSESARPFDFYDVKGDLEALFKIIKMYDVIEFTPDDHPALHPGQSARITLGQEHIGWIGVLHPQILDVLDIQGEIVVFELNLLPCLNFKIIPNYQHVSKFPLIRRDLSMIVDEDVSAHNIEQSIWKADTASLLKAIDFFDVYTGQTIPSGKKSLTVALTLQDDKRTLVETEINKIISAIIQSLQNEFAITLRD